MEAIRRIAFHQGNAKCLPAADKSFDLTFTVLALEQMWPILPQVLAEIRRVTRRHVVFIEAFREVNDWLGYLNLLVRNYFRADLKTMESAGFRPIALLQHLPVKHTHSVAVLVADVIPEL
jgi:ubiquinone/menaquinone biosynthesis C-methylase UbiE